MCRLFLHDALLICCCSCFVASHRQPRPTLFPYTTLFRSVEIPDAPRGPVKLDVCGSPIQNIYVRKVEKKDNELWNTVIHTFPTVSQFWKYKPETPPGRCGSRRSEEHTSELQSLTNLVCRL